MSEIDDRLSEIRSVRNSIWRYRKLLRQNQLSQAGRETIQKRLVEERSVFEQLIAQAFPIALSAPSLRPAWSDTADIALLERHALDAGRDPERPPRASYS